MTIENFSRRHERHKDVPPDALDEKRACAILQIGYHRLRRLAKECAAKGGPVVIIPENNARRFGRWYPHELLSQIHTIELSRPETAEPSWLTENDICTALRIGQRRFQALAALVKQDPNMVAHYGPRRGANNLETDFFSPRFREAVRVLDLALGAKLDVDKPSRPKPEVEIPPPENLADLTAGEKAAAAINDAELVAELGRVSERAAQLRKKIERNQRLAPAARVRILDELARIERFMRDYSFEMNYRPVQQMASKIKGLHNVLDRLFIQTR